MKASSVCPWNYSTNVRIIRSYYRSMVCHNFMDFIKHIELYRSCFKTTPNHCRPKFGGKPCQGSKERFRVMLPTGNGKCEPYSFTGLVSQFSLHIKHFFLKIFLDKKRFSLRISSVNLIKSTVIWSSWTYWFHWIGLLISLVLVRWSEFLHEDRGLQMGKIDRA